MEKLRYKKLDKGYSYDITLTYTGDVEDAITAKGRLYAVPPRFMDNLVASDVEAPPKSIVLKTKPADQDWILFLFNDTGIQTISGRKEGKKRGRVFNDDGGDLDRKFLDEIIENEAFQQHKLYNSVSFLKKFGDRFRDRIADLQKKTAREAAAMFKQANEAANKQAVVLNPRKPRPNAFVLDSDDDDDAAEDKDDDSVEAMDDAEEDSETLPPDDAAEDDDGDEAMDGTGDAEGSESPVIVVEDSQDGGQASSGSPSVLQDSQDYAEGQAFPESPSVLEDSQDYAEGQAFPERPNLDFLDKASQAYTDRPAKRVKAESSINCEDIAKLSHEERKQKMADARATQHKLQDEMYKQSNHYLQMHDQDMRDYNENLRQLGMSEGQAMQKKFHLETQIPILEKQIEELRGNVASDEKRKKEAESALAKLKQQMNNLNRQYAQESNEIRELDSSIQKETDDIKESQDKKERYPNDIEELDQKIESLKRQMQEQEALKKESIQLYNFRKKTVTDEYTEKLSEPERIIKCIEQLNAKDAEIQAIIKQQEDMARQQAALAKKLAELRGQGT